MQHERFSYSPIVDRKPLRFPNGARVAVWVIPNIEHFHFDRELDIAKRNGGGEVKLPNGRTLVYTQDSDSGWLTGKVKETPEAILEDRDLDHLIENILDTLELAERCEPKENNHDIP